jgi:hypothetical protein
MACIPFELPSGARGFVCGPTRRRKVLRCSVCHVPDTLATMRLCDWRAPGKRKTCDRPVCVEHAMRVGPEKDYCPTHAPLMQEVP